MFFADVCPSDKVLRMDFRICGVRVASFLLAFGFLLSIAVVSPVCSSGAEEVALERTGIAPAEKPVAPPYGTVIFSRAGQGQKQIYIIGQDHRSPVSGENDGETLQVQMEIFRIGEWLIRQRKIDLLLPEGYFCENSQHDQSQTSQRALEFAAEQFPDSPDDATLRGELTDRRTFTNAAKLLHTQYDIPLAQVEDRELYCAVSDSFRRLTAKADPLDAALVTRLCCFQERRTAAILQNIPAAIEREYAPGIIQGRKGLFIIGMGHIAEILRFLRQQRIELTPLPNDHDQPATSELSLLKENYGITVILPHTLAKNEKAMRITKLAGEVPD